MEQEKKIKQQAKEIIRLKKALVAISFMKRLPGEKDDKYVYNRCWNIAVEALTLPSKNKTK